MTINQGSKTYTFFFGEKKTLFQSIVDGFIKSLFNGIFVGGIALILLNSIENHLTTIEKRSALKNLRNDSIVDAINQFTEVYSKTPCLRDSASIELMTANCANQIDVFLKLLQERKVYLSSIFKNQEFDEIENTISVVIDIQNYGSNEAENQDIDK
ncbi:MAG: hypothetical protein AAGH46_12830, partial [Bacteroidota bacterium]